MELKPGYKKTDLAGMQEEWAIRTLGEFVSLQRGHDLTETQRSPGRVPVMSAAGLYGFHDTAIARGPGLVVGRSGASFGQVHFSEHDYWPHNTALYVTDFHGNDPRFAFYFLKALDFSRHNSGGAQPSLNRNFIYPISIRVPKPGEQRVIAAVLNDVDALIGALEKLIAKKRDLKQAAMQQLLTGKKRLPSFNAGKARYKQTDLGEMPEDWEVKPLGELGKFKNGINKSKEDFGHGFPFVNLMDVFGIPSISKDAALGLVNSSSAERSSYALITGDVLFVRSSVKPTGVGLTTLVRQDLANAVFSGFLIRFRDSGHLHLDYKEHCFGLKDFRDRLIASSTVSANTNINQDALKALGLTFPSDKEEQRAIATVLSDMDAEITALEQRREKTRALKHGMMQELLTGKTRLI